MVAQFARVRPLGLLQGFDLQLGAQAGQASREFVEVDGGAGPQPFQFHLGQASQQELSEAEDMFDQGERRLGDAHALVVLLAGLFAAHLRRELFTLLGKIAECDVAHRPGRLEPRVLKRRRHGDKPMQQPRNVLKKQLESSNAKA